jgi:hypothetical protein
MENASSRERITDNLPGVVDAVSNAGNTAQGANLGHCLGVEVD